MSVIIAFLLAFYVSIVFLPWICFPAELSSVLCCNFVGHVVSLLFLFSPLRLVPLCRWWEGGSALTLNWSSPLNWLWRHLHDVPCVTLQCLGSFAPPLPWIPFITHSLAEWMIEWPAQFGFSTKWSFRCGELAALRRWSPLFFPIPSVRFALPLSFSLSWCCALCFAVYSHNYCILHAFLCSIFPLPLFLHKNENRRLQNHQSIYRYQQTNLNDQ